MEESAATICKASRLGLMLAISLALLPAVRAEDEASAAGIRNRAPGFETVPGGPGRRIVLKPEMAARLGIRTEWLSAGEPKAVPSAAVFYDAKGAAWIYVSRKPGVFDGRRVQVESVTDGRAFLSDGPAAGTAVVTAGTDALNGEGVFGRR